MVDEVGKINQTNETNFTGKESEVNIH